MTEQEKILENADRTVRTSEAAIAHIKGELIATELMYAQLGMTKEEYLAMSAKVLSPENMILCEHGYNETKRILTEIFEVEVRLEDPALKIDTNALRKASRKRTFV